MNTPMIYPYSRISTQRQVEGTSLAVQREQSVIDKISKQFDLPISNKDYTDVGSAYHGKHLQGELGEFLQAIKDGDVAQSSIIVVYSLDRLSRLQLGYAQQIYLDLTNAGINIYSILDNKLYKAHDAADSIVSTIIFERAHNESATKSKRSTSAVNAHVERHLAGFRTPTDRPRWFGVGRKPVWVSVDEHKGVYANKYLTDVQEIIELSLKGISALQVVRHMNAKSDLVWDTSSISKLLLKKSLTGTYNFTLVGKEYSIPDYFPAVCDEDTFYRIRQIKSQRALRRGTPNYLALLVGNGLLKHHQCGGSARGSRSAVNHISYNCLGKSKGSDCCGFHVNAIEFEKHVYNATYDLIFNASQTVERVSPIPRIEATITSKHEQLNSLVEEFEAGTLPKIMFAKMNAIEADIEALNNELAEAKADTPVDNLLSQWELTTQAILENTDHSPERLALKQLLTDTLESVYIDKKPAQKFYNIIVKLRDGRTRVVHITENNEPVRQANEHELTELMKFRMSTALNSYKE